MLPHHLSPDAMPQSHLLVEDQANDFGSKALCAPSHLSKCTTMHQSSDRSIRVLACRMTLSLRLAALQLHKVTILISRLPRITLYYRPHLQLPKWSWTIQLILRSPHHPHKQVETSSANPKFILLTTSPPHFHRVAPAGLSLSLMKQMTLAHSLQQARS